MTAQSTAAPSTATAAATLTRGMAPAICETRLGKPDDLAFVVDCWVKNDPELRSMRTGESTRHVRSLIARPASRLIVAHVPGEPDAILGWAATEDGSPCCVHYIYVRKDARRQGVASAMVGERDVRIEYSHAAPARWPNVAGKQGAALVVPVMWKLNTERARTR